MPEPSYSTDEGLRTILTGIFTSRAVGRAGALTMQGLLRTVDVWRYDKSADGRTVRRAIAELIVLDHLPIAGDSSAGYYRCVTAAERRAQCHQLGSRIRSLGRRMRIFAAVATADAGGQLTLDDSLTIEAQAADVAWLDRVLAALGDDDDA